MAVILTTERLILRPFEISDIDGFYSYSSNLENIPYTMWGPNDRASAEDFVRGIIKSNSDEPRRAYDFAVTFRNDVEYSKGESVGGSENDGDSGHSASGISRDKFIGGSENDESNLHNDALISTGKFIGGSGIYLNKRLDQAELGWALHMDHWKRGYGTELAAALIKFGFEELKLHRIYARCNAKNYGSYRVMEHNNMRREGLFIKRRRGRSCDEEKWADEYQYAILDEEYFGNL